MLFIIENFYYFCHPLKKWLVIDFRDVAQPGSAHVWGAWGRKFESCHPDTTGQAGIISTCPVFNFSCNRNLFRY